MSFGRTGPQRVCSSSAGFSLRAPEPIGMSSPRQLIHSAQLLVRSTACFALAYAWAVAAHAQAGRPVELGATSDEREAHERSRVFFDRGVRLYRDGNVQAALAEFQVAYEIHPNSAALQNVALCQKALFHYGEAKATLDKLLLKYPHELSPADTQAARAAISELSALVGRIRLHVTPSTASVTLDDRPLSPGDLAQPIQLDVGEHPLRVEATGYEPQTRQITVTGGTSNDLVLVTLKPTHGFLTVWAPDEHSAIAVDGNAVAYQNYRGSVVPGRHVIQIYRPGFEPYEAVVELEAGQSVTVRGKVGEPLEDDDALIEHSNLARGPARQLRGWYGMLDLSTMSWSGAPESIDPDGHNHQGYGYGLHAGYRLFTPIAVEAVIGASHHDVTGTCERTATVCGSGLTYNYSLNTRRVGGALRLMSGGEKVRFTSSVGTGAASHDLRVFSLQAKGFDAYFALEAGAQINIDHVLLELVGFGWFESAGSIRAGNYAPYENGNGIQMFGLSIRAGWSEWTPRDAH